MNPRDLSLTVKYETFNLCYAGSNPTGLIIIFIIIIYIVLICKRVSINGRFTVFQTDDIGSNPVTRNLSL